MLVHSTPSSPAARPSLCLRAAGEVMSVQLPGPAGTSPLPGTTARPWRPEQSQGLLSDERTALGRQQHAQAAAAGPAAGLLLSEGVLQEKSVTPEFWGSSSRRHSQSPAWRLSASQQQQWQAGPSQQKSGSSSGRAERPRQPSPLLAAARAKAAAVEAQHHRELAWSVLHTACNLLLSFSKIKSIVGSAFPVVAGSSLPQSTCLL